ncbi:DUF6417 family protein [Streptomyces sp. NPDC002888]|uniref:DUF6417 family protein n=1 Tax=Streptomyces sp. NPDC002888 TaxID=3364668 RepID=UPI0036A48736
MDDYDRHDLDEIDVAPVDHPAARLALLTHEEAHGLLGLLLTVAEDDHLLSPEADRFAHENAARKKSSRPRRRWRGAHTTGSAAFGHVRPSHRDTAPKS